LVLALASAARTPSGSQVVLLPDTGRVRALLAQLDVTAAATESSDTLDVFLQSTLDGQTWDDFVHFTQVLGNGGVKSFLAKWVRDVSPTVALAAPKDGTLAAGVNQGPVGNTWRVKRTIVDGGGSPTSFTFSLGLLPVYER